MISERILSYFKSKEDEIEKGYSTLITNIYPNEMKCDQESITIETKTVRVPPSLLLLNNNTIDRELIISADINVNENGLYYGELGGYINKEIITQNNEPTYETASHSIEVLRTPLQKEIEIIFNENFEEMPYINITIDKKNRDLYREYKTDFESYIVNEKYTGVKIIFEGLKTRKVYPNIGITIIGDKPDETYYLEDNQKIIIVEISKKEQDEEENEINIPISNKEVSITINNPKYETNNEEPETIDIIKITDSCGKAKFTIESQENIIVKVINEDKSVTRTITPIEPITNISLDVTEIYTETQNNEEEG